MVTQAKINVRQVLLEDLAVYREVPLSKVEWLFAFNAQERLANEWRLRNPQTPAEVDQYYREQDAYIVDLSWFNLQPSYWTQNRPLMFCKGYVADFGGGIGSLALALAWLGCKIAYIDLPSPQREFAEWRFKRHGLPISVHESLTELHDLEAIVSTDTIEHLHPDTLPTIAQQMWDALKPVGEVRTISKFGKDDTWPMHYDSGDLFEKAMRDVGFSGGPVIWKKNGND